MRLEALGIEANANYSYHYNSHQCVEDFVIADQSSDG
jgi:hypothetical protein